MKYLIGIIPLLLLFSCRKDDFSGSKYVDDLPGKYHGLHTWTSGEEMDYLQIIENNDSTVRIKNWVNYSFANVLMHVDGKLLSIKDVEYTHTSYGMGGSYVWTYSRRLNAEGTFNPETKTVILDYVVDDGAENPYIIEEGHISVQIY